jgi:hypothetical protein
MKTKLRLMMGFIFTVLLMLLALPAFAQDVPPEPPPLKTGLPYLDEALKVNEALLGLPALPLVLLGALALGYFLKFIPPFKNEWIPFGVVTGAILANLGIVITEGSGDYIRAVILGMGAGVASIAVHRKWLKDWLDPKIFGVGLIVASLGLGLSGCAWFNPTDLKPAPVAEGQDSVVVNAQRVQKTSLFAYEKMINWELANRAILPAEVSRAVDKARAEFMPNWRASRAALKEYEEARGGNLDTLHRLTTALSVAQANFLKLTGSQHAGDVTAVFTALTQLNEAVATLRQPVSR